jgi:hypothetical protein
MMKTVVKLALMLVYITAAFQIILGLVIWFGVADAFILVHILGGIVFVLSLWTLAIVAARLAVNLWLVSFAFVWGLMVVILGLIQEQLIPDQGHWIIQAVHLIVSLAAIGLARQLSSQSMRRLPPAGNQQAL